ncbi:MAG: choice-of-anchor W domain-containing protein [Candidatus Eisenbacteria bacterium]
MKPTGIGSLLASGLALAVPGLAAAALSTSHLGSDAELSAILPIPVLAAEGRIGDRGGSATYELDVGPSAASPAMTGQFSWKKGEKEAFELTYHAGSGLVTFLVDDKALTYRPAGTFTEIFIRARAAKKESEVEVKDLVLDGEDVEDEARASGDHAGIDILRIRGASLTGGFRLTGKVSLSWEHSAPEPSELAFEIQVGAPDAVTSTSPASWGSVKKMFRN